MKRHRRVDAKGAALQVGDCVRIVATPDLSGMPIRGQRESLPVFKYLVGKYKIVRGFDEFGCVELSFVVRRSAPVAVNHTVWLEPYLVRKRRARPNPSFQRTALAAAELRRWASLGEAHAMPEVKVSQFRHRIHA